MDAPTVLLDRTRLLAHGFIEGRAAALDIVEHALRSVDPAAAVGDRLRLEGSILSIDGDTFALDGFDHLYVIGAGKATYHQAVALERILGDRISDGFISIRTGQLAPFTDSLGALQRIRVVEAGHPVPDAASVAAGQEVLAIADCAGARDLIVCLMSGGVSAQCICPVPSISVADKTAVNRLLVTSGAEVTEIMAVRRHLSQIKGGRLALRMHPATILALTVSDEKTDAMEWNTDWTSADSSTTADAVRILTKYGLWERAPKGVRAHLRDVGDAEETPKSLAHVDVHNHMIVKTKTLGQAAAGRAAELGLTPLFLTSLLSGESREVGRALCCVAREVALSGHPVKAPCALIATGETAVRIVGETQGSGGANQELAAGACLDLAPTDPIAVCALDTDGSDGPTLIAGALTDGTTAARAAAAGVDLHAALVAHDVSRALSAAEDIVVTGPTGTNVNDLVVVVVLPPVP